MLAFSSIEIWHLTNRRGILSSHVYYKHRAVHRNSVMEIQLSHQPISLSWQMQGLKLLRPRFQRSKGQKKNIALPIPPATTTTTTVTITTATATAATATSTTTTTLLLLLLLPLLPLLSLLWQETIGDAPLPVGVFHCCLGSKSPSTGSSSTHHLLLAISTQASSGRSHSIAPRHHVDRLQLRRQGALFRWAATRNSVLMPCRASFFLTSGSRY